MNKNKRLAKSFTIDPGVFAYIARTAEDRSVSGRLNELLQRAVLQENYDRLEREAEEYFSTAPRASRQEARAFQKASARSMARE